MLARPRAMLTPLGPAWAILGAMLAHLGAMLANLVARLAQLAAHVGPSGGGYVGPPFCSGFLFGTSRNPYGNLRSAGGMPYGTPHSYVGPDDSPAVGACPSTHLTILTSMANCTATCLARSTGSRLAMGAVGVAGFGGSAL